MASRFFPTQWESYAHFTEDSEHSGDHRAGTGLSASPAKPDVIYKVDQTNVRAPAYPAYVSDHVFRLGFRVNLREDFSGINAS